MNKHNDKYEELSKIYTDEEIVDSFVFNEELPEIEQLTAKEEFLKLRLASRRNRTPEQKLLSQLMQMKILLQAYFKQSDYDEAFSFSEQLKRYLKLTSKAKEDFAEDIGIFPIQLDRLLSGNIAPDVELFYRLEKHSNGQLPAFYWWRLHARRLEYLIRTDLEKKAVEGNKVKNVLPLSV